MANFILSRRSFLTGTAAGASSLVLAGCDQFDFLGQRDHEVRDFLERANTLTYQAQRILGGEQTLARTYDEAEIRQAEEGVRQARPGKIDSLKAEVLDHARGERVRRAGEEQRVAPLNTLAEFSVDVLGHR